MGEAQTIEILAVCKGRHRYLFYWRAEAPQELFSTLKRFADDPAYEFTWWDMVLAAKHARRRLLELTQEARA